MQAGANAVVDAAPEHVFRMLADYQRHHRRILPPQFSHLVVEQGGIGAGTVVRYDITAGRRTRGCRMRVTEPEHGRILTESDENSGLVTTYTVMPEGRATRVRIESRWPAPGGLGGVLDRLFARPRWRRLHRSQLRLLAQHMRRTTG